MRHKAKNVFIFRYLMDKKSETADEWIAVVFDSDSFTDREVWHHFRFWRPNLFCLNPAHQIPGCVCAKSQDNIDGIEALCTTLKRLACPNRWMKLWRIFGWSPGALLACAVKVESGAFTHFECGEAACFPVRNWRILRTQMKGRCWCFITISFHGDRFSSVLENQMQIWSTNFGVWPVSSHWLLPSKYNIPSAIRWQLRLPP